MCEVAIVKATQCDAFGNCRWKGSSRNFNPECATAAKFTIVECEEIVPLGFFAPEDVHLSGAFVDAIVQTSCAKRIERLTTSQRGQSQSGLDLSDMDERQKKRYRIIKRAALELSAGVLSVAHLCKNVYKMRVSDMVVNLCIRMPTLVPSFVAESVRDRLWLQSENGILGVGAYPLEGEQQADLFTRARRR